MAEEHFLLPEEDRSYLDYIGAALRTVFPKTVLAYDLLEDPIKEGVASATRPWDPELDYTQAGHSVHYFQNYIDEINREIAEGKTSKDDSKTMEWLEWAEEGLEKAKLIRSKVVPDKISRFIKGALGEDTDYVETQVEKDLPLKFKEDYYQNIDFQETAEYLKDREDYRKINQTRTDILRLGLGLDQRYDSMVESEYKPTAEELAQITTKGEDAYVGQVGWKSDRPVWDFRDKDFYGFEGYAHKRGDPARNLDDIVRQHGEFRGPEGRYEAFSDVWDFSALDKGLELEEIDTFMPAWFDKKRSLSIADVLDYMEFYQAPQLYGRRYLESDEYFIDEE